MQIAAKQKGDKKDGSESTWTKIKFDRQIVAIAKVNGADTIYSTDRDVERFGRAARVKVLNVYDLPAPRPEQLLLGAVAAQAELPVNAEAEPEADATPKESEIAKTDGQAEIKPEPAELPGGGNGSAQGPAPAEGKEEATTKDDGEAEEPAPPPS